MHIRPDDLVEVQASSSETVIHLANSSSEAGTPSILRALGAPMQITNAQVQVQVAHHEFEEVKLSGGEQYPTGEAQGHCCCIIF